MGGLPVGSASLPEERYGAADAVLYGAKEQGRNRYVLGEDGGADA